MLLVNNTCNRIKMLLGEINSGLSNVGSVQLVCIDL